MAGRASIVGAAATHVGKVRDHNEDAHFIDADLGLFLVCDGMGGHAAGEVASALAIREICQAWGSDGSRRIADHWLERGTPDAKKQLIDIVRAGVLAAHRAILAEADRDDAKSGMGTTLVGAMIVGGELVFAHAGDSRAYLVRDGISMQLTEDHTLLARLLAAGIDVDVSGEGARFRSMLTNALGIGEECKVSTFVVPLADGDRFLLCSDGISEYVPENEVGDVLTKHPSPARAAQQLIDLALERGGGDNATAVVVRVLEAGETPAPADQRRKDDAAIEACALWGRRVTPQQRLRALRIAIPRDHVLGDKLPPHALGDRVAWIVLDGELVQDGVSLGPGAFVYPESLVNPGEPQPALDRDAFAITRSDVRALAIRADDFRELCDDDGELGEALLESLAALVARRFPRPPTRDTVPRIEPIGGDPQLRALVGREVVDARRPSDPNLARVGDPVARERAATVPGQPARRGRAKPAVESPIIAPAPPRAASPQTVARPSPLPPQLSAAAAGRASPLPPQLAPRIAPPMPAQASARAVTTPGHGSAAVAASPQVHVGSAASMTPQGEGARRDTPRARRASIGPMSATLPPATLPAASTTGDERAHGGLRSVAHAIAAPAAVARAPLPLPAPVAADPPFPPAERTRKRPSSFPEIEAYFEIEADLPPDPGGEPDPELESDLALSIALSGDLYSEESVSVSYDDDATEVMETLSNHPGALNDAARIAEPLRQRAITAEDGAAVSGTISGRERAPSPRAKRHSEGFDD